MMADRIASRRHHQCHPPRSSSEGELPGPCRGQKSLPSEAGVDCGAGTSCKEGQDKGAQNMRVLVDLGSLSEILYYDCFQKLKLRDEDLQTARTPLVGFSSKPVYPKGKISLRVQVGGASRQVDFLVVDVPSPYNVMMGRTWLHGMEAVPSTRHQKLKFPLENLSGRTDVITIRGDQHMARQCLMALPPGEAESSQVHMAELDREGKLGDVGRAPTQKSIEDLTVVRIDPADPNRFFLVGS
ncbi:hypothetical protein AAC387_Pa04g1379 [Persea americana]